MLDDSGGEGVAAATMMTTSKLLRCAGCVCIAIAPQRRHRLVPFSASRWQLRQRNFSYSRSTMPPASACMHV